MDIDDVDSIGGCLLFLLGLFMYIAIMVCIGGFIGGFHSLKNYVESFKINVIDSNRIQQET